MNEDIKKMATLLRTGHTMLNRACPICNNPIFRNSGGLTFCPVCNREVIIVDEESNNINDKKKENVEVVSDEIKKSKLPIKENNLNENKSIILEKINLISLKLKSENQIDLIDKYADILLKLYKILKNNT